MTTIESNKSKENAVGLNYPMLTKTNYAAWSMKMKVFMQAHGVWEAIDPKDPKVTLEEKTDKLALAAIYQGIPEDVLLSLAEKTTAKSAWEAIKLLSLGADRVKQAKAQTLKGEFESLSMKETDQLDDFCMRLNGLVTNIRALGEKVEESYVVKKLLRAVPTKFLQIASAIEQFGNLEEMSVEEVIGSLKAHEERLRGSGEVSEGKLLLTEEEWKKREQEKDGQLLLTREEWQKRSSNWGTRGGGENRSRDGYRGVRDRSKVKCFNCGAYGHFAGECRKSRKEKEARDSKPEVNLSQVNDDEPALLLAECGDKEKQLVLLNEEKVIPNLVNQFEHKGDLNIWYLDNGASNHMTGERSKFKSLDERVSGQVKFGDGSTVKIEGKGSVSFICKNGEVRTLADVYFIPTLRNNIISLGQLSEAGNKVILEGDHLWVYEKSGTLLLRVKRTVNRLYKVMLECDDRMCLLSKAEEKTWLWHARLGHVNFQAMQLMSKNGMAYGVPEFCKPKEVCKGCLLSKQTRKSFPAKTEFVAKGALELIHADLCGPITPATPAGNRYFLLLVDDFSRMMWVFMLKRKTEALDAFKKFKALVEKKTAHGIQVLRTDRGGEFCSKEFLLFCELAGIMRHYTAPYSPQQNGVVERRNRTVVAMARSLLKERNIPAYFWGEAVRHAVYVLNRLPTRALSMQTPYESWTGNKPNLEYLRVFGCLSHMKLPAIHTTKLSNRSKTVIYLGKEPGTKACRLFDPSAGTVHVSRDVVFEEGKGWNWSEGETEVVSMSNTFTVFGVPESPQIDISVEDGENMVSTPLSSTGNASTNNITSGSSESVDYGSETSSSSSEPRKFRLLSDIYDTTEVVEAEDELLLSEIEEPVTYEQAAKEKAWRVAMEKEIEAIESNKTWELMELPTGHKPIDLKWVFKLKKDTDGKIIKHKARLVAKGYVQKHGVDYEEVFAPVTRMETVRLLIALAARNEWEIHHLDVKSAFLNGVLLEEVYVSQPRGFEKEGEERKVYKLIKALYGLKQAPRAWYARLNKCLTELGFTKCPFEHAVYIKHEGNEALIVGVYVDDLLVTGTSVAKISKFKQQMNSEFEMSNLGKLAYYIGIEVNQIHGRIELKQTAYAKKVLEKAGLLGCNSVKYPMEPKVQLHKDENGKAVDPTQFKSMVGGLRYLVHTRPDLAFSVGVVSRFMERPTTLHLNAVKRILRYVQGTLNYGLVYTKARGDYLLTGFSDSDLAGNVDDRKSTGGMAFYLNESLITWVSQKQRCVALSSCEAEFMAATSAACQGIWLHKVLSQISEVKAGPVVLYIDNKSAIDLSKNPVFHGRSKHIDVRYHFIRECVEKGAIIIKHVRTEEQRADVLTKALHTAKFEKMRDLLGVKNLAE